MNEPFLGRPGQGHPGRAGTAVRPLVLAAAVLMVAALIVYFLPPGLWTPAEPPPAAVLPTPPMPAAEPAAPVASAAPGAAEVAASEAEEGTAAQPAGETVFAVPPPEAAASDTPAAEAAAPAGLVQLRTTDASWIDVRDAGGQVLLSRTVQPGESVGLDGTLPLRLVVGNAAATELGFRGRPVDLAAHTRDNVARLELR